MIAEQLVLPFAEPVMVNRIDMRTFAANAGMHAVAGTFSFNNLVMYARHEAPEFLRDSQIHDERAVNIDVVEHIEGRPRYVAEMYHLGRRTLSRKIARIVYGQVHPQAVSDV